MKLAMLSVTFRFARIAIIGAFAAGCLNRPDIASQTVTNTNYTTTVATSGVDKVDLLFMIDNSASMGDKQVYLQAAIPDLVNRLISPNCVDSNSNPISIGGTVLTSDVNGKCDAGTAEFPPVHDLHIGIVTSSLGNRGTSICPPDATIQYENGNVLKYNDDQGHLINRVDVDGSVLNAAVSTNPPSSLGGKAVTFSDNFLAWLPNSTANSGKEAGAVAPIVVSGVLGGGGLIGDFAELVTGAGQYGCGIESQLESWYRFLIQPDPYASISGGSWQGYDLTLLQQRKDFLRPDSLVAVLVISDENDSEIDVRSYGGGGGSYLQGLNTVALPTSACLYDGGAPATLGPNSPNCITCAVNNAATSTDPNCIPGSSGSGVRGYQSTNVDDVVNLRHVHMKERFGVDPQYPIERYALGLTSAKVPDRIAEYSTTVPSGTPQSILPPSGYTGLANLTCTNPLFATQLPDPAAGDFPSTGSLAQDAGILCNLPAASGGVSARSPGLVFYAHIGGVPYDLVSTIDSGVISPNIDLQNADWVKILGNDPASFDYTGIDSRMMETIATPPVGSPDYIDAGLSTYNFNTRWVGPRNGALGSLWSATNTNLIADLNGNNSNGTAQVDDTFNSDGTLATMGNHYGREWSSSQWVGGTLDLNYACTFALPPAQQHNCGDPNATATNWIGIECDCPLQANSSPPYPPLCGDGGTNTASPAPVTLQTRAKAYPTVRELQLAQLLGAQAVVASICPIHPVFIPTGNTADPLYGYRPAVSAIISRLKNALAAKCLPQALVPDSTGAVACDVLAILNVVGPQSSCTAAGVNLQIPTSSIESEFRLANPGLTTVTTNGVTQNLPVCLLPQSPVTAGGSCSGNATPSFCYVVNTATSSPAGKCSYAIQFSQLPQGADTTLQCISSSGASSGDAGN